MPPFLRYFLRRFLIIPLTLVVVTMVMYGAVMLTPVEARVSLYLPKGNARIRESTIRVAIRDNYLDQPFHIQYGHWASTLLRGGWGYSPSIGEDVLPALLHRTPVSLELLFYSLLVFVPLSLYSGFSSAWKPGGWFDRLSNTFSFIGTSLPIFIVSMFALAIFYIKLGWFAPERISPIFSQVITGEGFHAYTGFITLDSLLNARFDIFLDALKHLVLPVATLSLFHIASLSRLTRSFAMDEMNKVHILAARARGVREYRLRWVHVMRATLGRSLTSIGTSVSTIMMSLFITEMIYTINGVSSVIVKAMREGADAPATLGFMIYSVILILSFMFVIDLLIALVDPRIRDEVISS